MKSYLNEIESHTKKILDLSHSFLKKEKEMNDVFKQFGNGFGVLAQDEGSNVNLVLTKVINN
jgi:hypothetical protein